MSDITFMRGYGIPRGAGMDYAGYHGMLVNSQRRRPMGAASIPLAPEPGVFAKIPALDGFEESYGSEYTFRREHAPAGYGDMVLPTLDTETGEWLPVERNGTAKLLGLAAVGVGLWWLFGR